MGRCARCMGITVKEQLSSSLGNICAWELLKSLNQIFWSRIFLYDHIYFRYWQIVDGKCGCVCVRVYLFEFPNRRIFISSSNLHVWKRKHALSLVLCGLLNNSLSGSALTVWCMSGWRPRQPGTVIQCYSGARAANGIHKFLYNTAKRNLDNFQQYGFRLGFFFSFASCRLQEPFLWNASIYGKNKYLSIFKRSRYLSKIQ